MPPRGGGRGGGAYGMRSFRQDRSILAHRVKKGTTRRMLRFAIPYRKILSLFLPLVVLDAALGAVNPLILRAIIDRGILGHNRGLVIDLALLAAGIALADAVVSLLERRASAIVGEGLIFDMRSKVFRHVQRMPLAFFTRTQTGALVSRLNNDVIGAQQAFTDLLSNMVGNIVTVAIVLGAMFFLSWQITLVALLLLPLFVIPARLVGRKLGAMTKENYDLNARDEHGDERALQRGGRHAGQALRPARGGGGPLRHERGPRARHRDRPGPLRPPLLRRAHARPPRWPRPSPTASGASRRCTGCWRSARVVALTAYLARLLRAARPSSPTSTSTS